MKLVKSLLLGSVAGLAATAAAQAADLPSRKAAPVEYVRVCSAQGAGFFYIPGTDTCLRIGGRVRAEYRYVEPRYTAAGNGRLRDVTGFRALGRLNVDTRTETAYGTLRAFFRYDVDGRTGSYGTTEAAALDKAYIQFAGITAGRGQSFFDFYADDINWGTGVMSGLGSDNGRANQLAYTATFGGGFSATIAIEDRNQRSVGPASYAQAGERIPDVVANVRYESGWGAAQLSGAIHQMNSAALAFGQRVDGEYGFAVQAGVKINLPMLAKGDVLWLQAAYAQGALNYLGVGNSASIGPLATFFTDGVLTTSGSIKKTDGYGLTAAFTHYWTPSWRSSIIGNYTHVDFSNNVNVLNNTSYRDTNIWTVAGSVIWTPVSGLDIGVEVLYTRLDARRYVTSAGLQAFGREEDVLEARLRFQRDF